MKSHLHKIEITNFKVFREFTLNLEGRHLLVYGANGAEKSSLYWALYTFLQSTHKPQNGVSKYFTPRERTESPQYNLHESDLKLLVLDDLLVSLDMSNRMMVMEIPLPAPMTTDPIIITDNGSGMTTPEVESEYDDPRTD